MNITKHNKDIESKIRNIIEKESLELISYRIFASRGKAILRCLVDYPQGGVTLDECAKINKKIVSLLEQNNFLGDNYIIEVNSPGIGRKLREYKDFRRVKEKNIGLWLKEPVNDKCYYEGILEKLDFQHLSIKQKDKIIDIDMKNIKVGKELPNI